MPGSGERHAHPPAPATTSTARSGRLPRLAAVVAGATAVAVLSTAGSAVTTTSAGTTSSVAPTLAATSTTGLRTVAQWQALFDGQTSRDYPIYLKLSQSTDSWDYYNLAFGLDAYVAMFRATGQTKYLDTALLLVNNVIASAKASTSLGSRAFHDAYLGWVSNRSDAAGQEVPLFESFLWRYVMQMLWSIKTNPTVYAQSKYLTQYQSVLAFSEKNIFDKWYNRGAGPGGGGSAGYPNMYRQNTNMASHWAYISMLMSRMTQDSMRRSRAVTVETNIDTKMPVYGSSLRQQFLHNPSVPAAYEWNSYWGYKNGVTAANVQDVPHGSAEVAYILEAYKLGDYWTSTDVTALSHTLTDVIWRANGTYAANVDGSGAGNGVIIDGFMKLGRYSTAIQQRLENYSGSMSDNNYCVIDFFANGALNAKFLGL